METRTQHIRVSPTTKQKLEQYREQCFDAHVPIGRAVADLLAGVDDNE